MNAANILRAIANDKRLQILDWLKRPTKHFPPQRDGDLIKDGVCGVLIARKLKISQPTTSEHLKILTQTKLLNAKRLKGWTFYKRDETAIKKMKQAIVTKI